MVEMLMTTLILAIGLLGLAMLQTMSLKSARGGTSMTTATKVAEGVMDQVELQGRISWLNLSDSTVASVVPVASQTYIAIPVGGNLGANTLGYDNTGTFLGAGVPTAFFQANIYHLAEVGTGTAAGGFLGDFNVVVTFTDDVTGLGFANQRTVSVTRRIAHG